MPVMSVRPFLAGRPCVVRTDFLVTASADGHVKFWKKKEQGVEFVKHFRAHLGMGGSWC